MSGRALRRTATAVGVGTAAGVDALRFGKRTHVAQRDDPSPEEVRWHAERNLCAWCDDTRTFKSLSQHLTRGHGIDLAWLREYIGVRKRTSFVDAATREQFVANGRQRYDPEKLRYRPGQRKVLSAYGLAVQREKIKKARESPKYAESIRQAGLARRLTLTCVICGVGFQLVSGLHRKQTCSPACNEERRKRVARTSEPLRRANESRRRPPRHCSQCGAVTQGRRVTCSRACMQADIKAKAKARGMPQATREGRRRYAASQPVRLCVVEGCGRRYHVHWLCNRHSLQAENLTRPWPEGAGCSLPECEAPRVARGLCPAHFAQRAKQRA